MIDSIVNAASQLKEKVTKKSEVVTLLNEATNNDNWNISNSKLLILSDHTYDWNDYNIIMKHLWGKITLKSKEWRKIFKALHTLEFLIKNGAPRIIQEVKDDLYKIRSLQDMEYSQEGKDKCSGIREKSKQICELVLDKERLDEEREFAKKNRDKFSTYVTGVSSSGGTASIGSSSKYQGFGSEDLAKYSGGYNLSSTKNKSGYDPYTSKKGSSMFDKNGKDSKNKDKDDKDKSKKKDKKKKKTKKKKSDSESSEESSSSSSSESENDDSSEDESGKKKNKKTKGIIKPKRNDEKESKISKNEGKKEVKKEVKIIDAKQKQNDILELLETTDNNQKSSNINSNIESDDILNLNFNQFTSNTTNNQFQDVQNMFQNINISSGEQNQSSVFGQNQSSVFGQNQSSVFGQNQSNVFGQNNSQFSQPFVQPQTSNTQNWMMGSTNYAQQANPTITNTTNTMNLFGDMNISQPVNQTSPQIQTPAGINLFDGMNYQSSSSQPVSKAAPPSSNKQNNQALFEDFEDFQDSSGRMQTEPEKEDSWGMGRHLFNLSNLKKDNELKNKEKGFYKGVPGKTSLFTKGEDLNSVWNGALNSQNLQKPQTGVTTKSEGSFGFAPSSFASPNTQTFGGVNPSTNIFGQSTASFGGVSTSSGQSVFSSGFPNPPPGADVFASQNPFASSGVFQTTGAFPSSSVFASSGGFPTAGIFSESTQPDINNWQYTMNSGGANTGVFGSTNQQNKSPFF